VDGGVDRKAAKVAKERGEEGVSEDGFSEGRKPAEGGLESKERRSSVGFFDFVMFRAFRGFSDGRVYRKAAKVAEERKEEGVSQMEEGRKPAEGGLKTKEFRSSVGFFDFVRFRAFRGFSDGRVDRKAAKVAEGRKEEGVSEDGFSVGMMLAPGGGAR
jgi:hypothetical protein